MRRVFATNYSLCSSLGSERNTFVENLFAGASGVVKNPSATGDFPVRNIALIQGLNSIRRDQETVVPRLLQGLGRTLGQLDGIVFGLSRPLELEFASNAWTLQNCPIPLRSSAQAQWLRDQLGAHCDGLPVLDQFLTINEACITGTAAIGMAAQRIKLGIWKRALVLVSDLRATPEEILRFHALGALSTRDVPPDKASCPFSKDRDGFVIAEGAGALLLEGAEQLSSSVAPIAEIAGYAQTADAWRLTEGRPDGSGPATAMAEALRAAGIEPSDIDCISAHGTSTVMNDYLETLAIKKVFSEKAKIVPITALKSQMGHANHASGMLQVLAGIEMLVRQKIPATINFDSPDPACDLDYVPNVARSQGISYLMCNSFAFGGLNASLILKKSIL